ncbi:MAG: RNA polymerase sigma factor [Planctomycetota bacterium]|jgi:RNA polymerase sigma factor (sigma-70 family)
MSGSDGALLGEYLDAANAAAFEELSRRHAGMVYGVCRRVLGAAADAEDAAQAVFLALVRSAAKLRGSGDLTGWLYRTAVLTARYHARSRAHRRKREQEAAAMAAGSAPAPASLLTALSAMTAAGVAGTAAAAGGIVFRVLFGKYTGVLLARNGAPEEHVARAEGGIPDEGTVGEGAGGALPARAPG